MSENTLREALPSVAAIVPALIALTGHSFERGVALTLASVTVANSTIRAFHQGVGIIVLDELRVCPG